MARKHLLISIPETSESADAAALAVAQAALAAGGRENGGDPLPDISRKLGFLGLGRSQTLDFSTPLRSLSSTPVSSASPFNGSYYLPSPHLLQRSLSSPSCETQTPAANQATIREQIIKTRNGLRTLRNLKFFQDMEPGVQQKLAKIVQHVTYAEGTVIFRQNDPPGSCYIILSGEIGIFQKFAEGEKDPSKDDDGCAIAHVRRNSKRASLRRSSSLGEIMPLLSPHHIGTGANTSPMRTTEGFSFYSNTDDFGAQVATLHAGRIIGELALQQDAPRSASVQCMKDSEFLVISRKAFDNVMKEEMARVQQEKLDFLKQHVPGVRELPAETRGKPHASYFFRKSSHNRGHTFMSQGASQDECIYVLISGAVEFQRRDDASRPESATSGSASPAHIGAAGPKRSHSASRLGRGGPDESITPTTQRLGVLLPGGLFGSLSLVVGEPFTVSVVSTACEVLCVSGIDVRKLPNKLLETIRDYLMRAMTWRLERLRTTRKLELPSMAPEPPRGTRESESKQARLFKAGKFHRPGEQALHRHKSAPGGRPSTSPGSLGSGRTYSQSAVSSLRSVRPAQTGEHSRSLQGLPAH